MKKTPNINNGITEITPNWYIMRQVTKRFRISNLEYHSRKLNVLETCKTIIDKSNRKYFCSISRKEDNQLFQKLVKLGAIEPNTKRFYAISKAGIIELLTDNSGGNGVNKIEFINSL